MDHLYKLKEKAFGFSVHDALMVVLCMSAVYLLRSRDTYEVIPVWRNEINTEYYENKQYPGITEKRPAPVVTDLESDGITDIIIISNNYLLEIYTAPILMEITDSFSLPYLVINRSVKLNILPVTTPEDKPVYPLVIETGFIDLYNSTDITQTRHQVVVIGFSNWTVVCFDSKLNLLWQTKLLDDQIDIGDHYEVKAMAISVMSYVQNKKGIGSVYVGLNMEHSHTIKRDMKQKEQFPRMHQMGSTMHSADEETLSHFSVFALSGDKGIIRWSHLHPNFERKASQDTSFSHWKLKIHDSLTHAGEVPWTKHKDHILDNMPHYWNELSDTTIEPIDLKHKPKSSHHSHTDGVSILAPLVDIIGLDDQHISGLPFGGMRPHSPHEHVHTPSSLLIHNHNGVEILNIDSGKQITGLPLSSNKCSYADIDGDGTLDSVCLDICTAIAQVHQPIQKQLFTVPTCESPSFFGPVSFMAAFTSHKYLNEDSRLAMPALLVKSIGKRSGIFSHLMGRTLKSEQKGYDSVFVTSSGRVSSYAPHGQLNWQVLVNTGWDSYFTGHGSSLQITYQDREQIYNKLFKPSVVAFSPLVFGKKTMLVIFGWSSMSIVDLYDGYTLSEHSLPCQPTERPVVGDFNGDGTNDIIISCPFGYIGLTLEKTNNHIYTGVTAICVVAIVILLSWCCQPEDDEPLEERTRHR